MRVQVDGLPAGTGMTDISVEVVGSSELYVSVGNAAILPVEVPCQIDPTGCKVEYHGSSNSLTITFDPAPIAALMATAHATDAATRPQSFTFSTERARLTREHTEAADHLKRRQNQLDRLQEIQRLAPANMDLVAMSLGVAGPTELAMKIDARSMPLLEHIRTYQHHIETIVIQLAALPDKQQGAPSSILRDSQSPKPAQLPTPLQVGAAYGMAHAEPPSASIRVPAAETGFVDCSGLAEHLLRARSSEGLADRMQRTPGGRSTVAPVHLPKSSPAASMVAATSASLCTHGWAVCDGFAAAGMVGRVRDEVAALDNRYEPSEIWVGSDSGIGAQLVKPDVRGDKVLWMNDASIDNCRCNALNQLLQAMDLLVMGCLSQHVDSLANINERTDAMLAVYPGKAARFTKHIDNTARDGRRLTVLCGALDKASPN